MKYEILVNGKPYYHSENKGHIVKLQNYMIEVVNKLAEENKCKPDEITIEEVQKYRNSIDIPNDLRNKLGLY